MSALDVLCAQLTRDLFAIAKFLYNKFVRKMLCRLHCLSQQLLICWRYRPLRWPSATLPTNLETLLKCMPLISCVFLCKIPA